MKLCTCKECGDRRQNEANKVTQWACFVGILGFLFFVTFGSLTFLLHHPIEKPQPVYQGDVNLTNTNNVV